MSSNPQGQATMAELERIVKAAMDEVGGTITLSQVLEAIAPAKVEDAGVPAVLPVPQAITEPQREAIEKITEVFGKVIPTARRALEAAEISELIEEKQTLDQLKKLSESRHENIRTTLFNHFDVIAEQQGVTDGVGRDKSGHYILGAEARGEDDAPAKFTREVRNLPPNLDATKLRELAEDPAEDFSHEDYLAITAPTRVLDEHKLILHLKKNPRLIHAISKATRPGSKTISLNLRKT